MNTSHSSAQSPAELLEHIRALVAEAEQLVINAVTEPAAEIVEALRGRLSAAQKRLGEICATSREKVAASAHRADEAIRTHPYQALAVATATGLVVGVLLGRRCHRTER